MSCWVTIRKYAEVKGESPNAVKARLRAGVWLRDIHARQPEGSKTLWINLDAVEDWASGKKPAHQHGDGR